MKRGIFKLIPLFLATFLAIACDSVPPEPDTTVSENGMLYYAEGSSGEWVIAGIANPKDIEDGRTAFAPKNGYWYVIGIGSESDTDDEPVSMGTIQVEGGRLTFSPFTGKGFPTSSFTGTLDNGSLTIDSIPGRNYSGIKLAEGPGYSFKSSDDPWGTGGGLPSIPGGPNFGNPSKPPTSGGASFNPGKFVTDVIIIDSPNVKTAYEGLPVDLTGLKVEIRYNNGDKAEKTAADAKEFIVEPPVYTTAYGIHNLRYVGEYNNPLLLASSSFVREFRSPQNNANQGSSFYELRNPSMQLEATVTGTKEYFEGIGVTDFSGISIKAIYSNGEKTITPTSVYETSLTKVQSPDDSVLRIIVGSRYVVIPIKSNKVYSIRGIQLEGSPSYSAQVIYDDPRFFLGDAEKHWLSKFNNVNIRFLYKETSATKTLKITDAAGKGLSVQYPENFMDKNPKITFKYQGDTDFFTVDSIVPVYNKLVSITAESTVGKIVLNGGGPLPADNEQSFLKQIKISAVYQSSTDKNKTIKRDNILVYPTETSYNINVGVDTNLINAPLLETNVDTGAGGILNAANSKAYDDKNKLAKARVSFTTTSAGDSPQITEKSAILEVGVTGYK